MNTITLLIEEQAALKNTASADQVYYVWVGILALRGEVLPLFYHELPEHIEGSTFRLNTKEVVLISSQPK